MCCLLRPNQRFSLMNVSRLLDTRKKDATSSVDEKIGFAGLCVGLCLRTSLMYDVYDCIESTEMVE